MKKTQNAFALRDFDEERILSRPYFRAVVNLRGSDDDVLASFAATNAKTSTDLAENVDALRWLKGLVAGYTKRLLNHEFKLERIGRRRKTTDSDLRLWHLQQFYLARVVCCGELQRRISQSIIEGQKLLPKFFNRELGERLRHAREAIGLSRREVAAELGLALSSVQQYENGTRELSPYTLTRLSAILGRSPHYFLGVN